MAALSQTMFYELFLNGAWRDFTSKVYQRDGNEIVIARGRSDEGRDVDRSTCNAIVNNRDGDLSPRNPTGTYYGYLGRNTPLRTGVKEGDCYLTLSGTTSDYVTTPDSAGLSITGDIDVRVDVTLKSWVPSTGVDFAGKWPNGGGQRSWLLGMNATGTLRFRWSADGSTDVAIIDSTIPVQVPPNNRLAIRVTLDVNNGAAGNTVTFYTAQTIDDTWVQLGEAVVTAGTTSIFDGTAATTFGNSGTLSARLATGQFWSGQVRNGIGGSVVGNADVRSATDGAASFSDGTNTWTVTGAGAAISNRKVRFHGEVSSFPTQWDPTVTDVWVNLEASGILRRLGAPTGQPLRSTMYRGAVGLGSQLKAYWPCEDGENATYFSSGISGGSRMTFTGGTPGLASSTVFPCSAALPTAGSTAWVGSVRNYSSTDHAVSFLCNIPAAGTVNGSVLARIGTAGGAARWDVTYSTLGDLTLTGYNDAGTSVFTLGPIVMEMDGKLADVHLLFDDTGADMNVSIAVFQVGDLAGGFSSTGVWAGGNLTSVTSVTMAPSKNQTDVVFGHIRVENSVANIFNLFSQVNAFATETAGARIARLCAEEGVDYVISGIPSESAPMGYQGQKTFLELIRECEATDGGILYEPREYLALGYIPLRSLYNQSALLTLNYTANDLSEFQPIEDDQAVVNDVTVVRVGGSSARVAIESGPLSILSPSAGGIGKYDAEVNLSLADDENLINQAGWRAHIGSYDEQRFPVVGVNLGRTNFTASAALSADARALDVGLRLTVDNVPTWMSTQDVEQMVQGYEERYSKLTRTLTFNCSPWKSYEVLKWDGLRRWSGEGTVLAGTMTTTSTSRTVTNPTGVEWTHDDGDFDILVAGEVMTVTNVTGTGTTQTFDVTRSVNGVVKAQAAGAAVQLARPYYWALI